MAYRDSSGRIFGGILVLVLTVLGQVAWAQAPEQSMILTGRLLTGLAEVQSGDNTTGGPATTVDADFQTFWRDPRILAVDLRPSITFGHPASQIGGWGAGKNISALANVLGGGRFPLTLSYARQEVGTGSSESQGRLAGVAINTSTTTFGAGLQLRFKHLPPAEIQYRSNASATELPKALGGEEQSDTNSLTAKLNYDWWGWQMQGRYLRSQSSERPPALLDLTGIQRRNANGHKDLRFTATRSLPLRSTLSVNVDRSELSQTSNLLRFDNQLQTADALLSSQPLKRLTTNVHAAYVSNSQANLLEQALGVQGSTGTATSAPLSSLSTQNSTKTLDGGAGVLLGRGFSVFGNAQGGESNTIRLAGWGAGLGYQRNLRSGFFSANYSNSHTESSTTSIIVNTPAPPPFVPSSQARDVQTGTVSLSRDLPAQLKLSNVASLSLGTLLDRGTAYPDSGIAHPDHRYSEQLSLTRPLGRWRLTGSFSLSKDSGDRLFTHSESTAKGFGVSGETRGLRFSLLHQSNQGLALQVGNSLVFISNPLPLSPVLGPLALTGSASTSVTGVYQAWHNRFSVSGMWQRSNYTIDNKPQTASSTLSLEASFRLRRVRLIAGYLTQSQSFDIGTSKQFEFRRIFFQLERRFRLL
jgi:hypothetical protein